MRKKIISRILVLVMMAALFSGCHRPGSDTDEEKFPTYTTEYLEKELLPEASTQSDGEKLPTYIAEYLENEIFPRYRTQTDEMTATYYCQIYGGMSGDCYATTTYDNLYNLDQINPWLLAYNAADYNSDGIEDLFVITLDESGNSDIGKVNINRYIYFFDGEGNAERKGWHTTPASARERKQIFAFVDDKLIEMSFYDYSTHTEGDKANKIDYAVTNDIRWHTTSVNIITYSPETDNFDFAISYARYNHPSGILTWDSNYDDCDTEQDAITKFQTQLAEYGITGIVLPQGTTWANRWEDVFYLSENIDWNAFVLDTSAAVSEKCYGIEQIVDTYDGKTALNTTSGEIVFSHYKYELYPSQSAEDGGDEAIEGTDETTAQTDPMEYTQGLYTLEEAQEMTGLFILYPDGSFDRYYGGEILTWEGEYMTYGTDYFPEDLIMSVNKAENNRKRLEKGQLVLFWPYDNRVRRGLFAVEESGYSLFRTDDEGDLEGLILTRGYAEGTLHPWNEGHIFYWSETADYATINGIPKENYNDFPSTEGREFASFPANQTYTIGIVEGTTLVEKEYATDHMYFLHADESTQYTLTPTTGGYAVFDFSNTEPGEYVFTTSYWNEESRSRKVVSTYIEVG